MEDKNGHLVDVEGNLVEDSRCEVCREDAMRRAKNNQREASHP